ncbi:hypothetical protein GUJ93_ZPchr0138g25 [Zizania palustris]|uniref:Uncharacterized protein n=1 Tax=Zizania palustris TaxID=103762 RepID=A0A8J5R898_ZIZPA|nr:hypothetical protein GUJ93_ZPchr0138g25 [Zizania palustris]
MIQSSSSAYRKLSEQQNSDDHLASNADGKEASWKALWRLQIGSRFSDSLALDMMKFLLEKTGANPKGNVAMLDFFLLATVLHLLLATMLLLSAP